MVTKERGRGTEGEDSRIDPRQPVSDAIFESGDQTVGGDRRRRNESGAVLILALVYIIAISLIVGALASWAMNDLNNTGKFESASELHYAVSSVTNLAIESIRYTPLPSSTPPQAPASTGWEPCWTPATGPQVSQMLIDGYTIAVWCNVVEQNTSANTRTVTFIACRSALTSSDPNLAADTTTAQINCQAAPLLTVVVIFDDYPARGAPVLGVQCNLVGQCGEGMTQQSWIWGQES
jgi:hypothetical protein